MSKSDPKKTTASILSIGSELLKGSTVNTNAAFLGRHLTSLGFYVRHVLACDDRPLDIQQALNECFRSSRLVIASGGLGPTPDDVTRSAVAAYYRSPLVLSLAQWKLIVGVYKKLGRNLPESVRQEALYPRCAQPLVNRHGIALGFSVLSKNKLLLVLPGVPRELENLFEERGIPLIQTMFSKQPPRFPVIARTVGLSEPAIMEKLGQDFFKDLFEFGIYPHAGEVTLRLSASRRAIAQKLTNKIRTRLGEAVYAYRETSLVRTVLDALQAAAATVACAESCSGGLLSTLLTSEPGASAAFRGSIVCYANSAKQMLGVPAKILKAHGAVSEPVAAALASLIRKKMKSTYGVGITGIAGPSGATPQKPVGLVYIAIADAKGVQAQRYEFWGDRAQIQHRSAVKALECLWRKVTGSARHS